MSRHSEAMRMRNVQRLLSLGVFLGACALAGAADPGCGHTIESVPESVRAILAPLYAGEAPAAELAVAHRKLELLMLEAAHCKMSAQSVSGRSEDAERELGEWHSLDQWLYRLVNFLGLNAKGDMHADWRREYEIFADVYELEI